MMPASASPILYVNNQISIDAIDQNINYREKNGAGTSLDSENGWQPGIQLTGTAMRNLGVLTNLYIMGQFSWARASTRYVGAYSGGNYGDLSQRDGAATTDFDFRFGKGFEVGPSWMFTPYFGAGYHSWDRNLAGGGGYHEKYSHSYAGGGLLIQWAPTRQWVLSANGLAGSTFTRHMATSLTDGGYPIDPFNYNLGAKLMWKFGLSADYALTPQWHLNAGIDYTNFGYGVSNYQHLGGNKVSFEPNSRSGILTVKAGVGYSFYQEASRF